EQVEKTPDNTALVFEGEELTYKELDQKSDQLAHHIRVQFKKRTGRDLQPDTLVPLCLDRSLEMVVSILAVLKAGGAYVPIDPSFPKERIDYILSDTKAELILSQKKITQNPKLGLPKGRTIAIDLSEKIYQSENNKKTLPDYSRPESLAYIIYTSGTTGKPKGVMIEHKSIINLIKDLLDKYNIVPLEKFLLFANYVFDTSVEQMFLPLFSGGVLFIINNESILDSSDFTDFVINHQLTHLDSTPSYLNSIDPSKLNIVKRVVFGGEYLSKQLFNRYRKCIPTIINAYGPTETTITSLISINSYLLNGVSLQNTKVYVLDPNGLPVPIGVTGELHIAGARLARGYL
ncbi:amino acid adenylation domain-containing protein, partial [Sinomicrobium oceani]|uniref:amino acid adenylation domain-containing protein n=1 Tax=Sinomicrobium oceani TaxID=1150368 RepID=UPI00227B46AF